MTKPQPSPRQWLYVRGGETFGPLGSKDLKDFADQGRLSPDDLVSQVGTDRWVPAGTLKGLFSTTVDPSPVVEQVMVRPVEEDQQAESKRCDTRWRVRARKFIYFNLVTCAVLGVIKPPPAHVAALNEALRDIKETTRELDKIMEDVDAEADRLIQEVRPGP